MKPKIIIIIMLIVILLFGIIWVVKFNNTEANDESQNLNIATETTEQSSEVDESNNSDESQNSNVTTETTNQNSQQEEANNNDENSSLGSDNMNNEEIKINLIVNNKTFTATLENNETTKELIEMFPMTLNMSDLNSNEKYNYLDTSLTTNSSIPRTINAGDIKLYGNNCLVIFYDTFSSSYSYTDLGTVDNVDDFVDELGSGSVTIKFELAD